MDGLFRQAPVTRPTLQAVNDMSEDKKDTLEPVDLLKGRFDVPFESPVRPHQLRPEDSFQFNCHPGVSCFNACCKSIEITLTPYDILRLKRRLEMTSSEFVARHSLPYEMDHHGMPGLHLATKPGTSECVFLTPEGCSVYEDRPAACRYYAVGSMGMRRKDSPEVEDVYFLVKEDHCKGHFEPKTQTVAEYRKAQGVEIYDDMNRDWRDIIIKKRSSGPTIGAPSERSLQLFDMCSYDMDSFREFVQSPGFQNVFDLEEDALNELLADEDKLLLFAYRFLRQVLFGEMSIPLHEGARERRLEQAKQRLKARKEAQVQEQREDLDERYRQDD